MELHVRLAPLGLVERALLGCAIRHRSSHTRRRKNLRGPPPVALPPSPSSKIPMYTPSHGALRRRCDNDVSRRDGSTLKRSPLRAAGERGQVLAALIRAAARPLIRAGERSVVRIQVGVGEAVVLAAVERPAVLVDQLLDLDVVARRQRRLVRGRRRGGAADSAPREASPCSRQGASRAAISISA